MIRYISISLFLMAAFFCKADNDNQSHVVNLYDPADVSELVRQEIKFWTHKIESTKGGFIYLPKLASAYKAEFDISGDPKSILAASSKLEAALGNHPLDPVPVMVSLASTYMTQHRFCDALDLLQEAERIAPNKKSIFYALADVYGELGFAAEEKITLDKLSVDANFNYWVRIAKWHDGQGDLDQAILILEDVKSNTRTSRNTINKKAAWLYANLGDFYGHQGNIEKSKAHYIEALKMDASSWHAARGLAWISYSKNKDYRTANEILTHIKRWCKAPALDFFIAEIADATGESQRASIIKQNAVGKHSLESYGPMYIAKILDVLLSNDKNNALALTSDLLLQRETPENYAHYAQALCAGGEINRAEQIALTYVYGKTVEPGLLLAILPCLQQKPIIKQEIIRMLLDASFEIGPLALIQIEKEKNRIPA